MDDVVLKNITLIYEDGFRCSFSWSSSDVQKLLFSGVWQITLFYSLQVEFGSDPLEGIDVLVIPS